MTPSLTSGISMDGVNWRIAGATAPVYTTTDSAMMYLRCTIERQELPPVKRRSRSALNIHPSPLITAGKSMIFEAIANNAYAQLLASGTAALPVVAGNRIERQLWRDGRQPMFN